MSLDGWGDVRFVVTARAAALLRGCTRLPLASDARGVEEGPCRLVLLATPADDLGAAPAEAVPIAVVTDPPAGPCDARFVDIVFATATCSELAFRAMRALERGTVEGEPRLVGDALEVGSVRVPLSAVEQRLVERLLAAPGVPVSRGDLERLLGDADVSVDVGLDVGFDARFDVGAAGKGRALDAHVYRLRRKLRGVPGIRIHTLRQRGFVLSTDATTGIGRR